MPLRIDLHLHTQRHSRCSHLDETRLIARAVQAGLDGLVITEHHYQWSQEELDTLCAASGHPGFLLLSGFEYSSSQGDLLIYGLKPEDVASFPPGADPKDSLLRAQAMGAACIAAHPTRAALSFDERIAEMPFDGLEIRSTNLEPHEQRIAAHLARELQIPGTAASDAHALGDIGSYATEFDDPIQTMSDFCRALKQGRFRALGKLT